MILFRYGDNSYVCVQGHILEGDDGSSGDPDNTGGVSRHPKTDPDTTGTYWNVIAIGTEQSVLTPKGDMVYYSGAVVRLPTTGSRRASFNSQTTEHPTGSS